MFIGRDYIAEEGFDPPTSGLWAQHASAAPLCCLSDIEYFQNILDQRTRGPQGELPPRVADICDLAYQIA